MLYYSNWVENNYVILLFLVDVRQQLIIPMV